jgi:hypothetical protein
MVKVCNLTGKLTPDFLPLFAIQAGMVPDVGEEGFTAEGSNSGIYSYTHIPSPTYIGMDILMH